MWNILSFVEHPRAVTEPPEMKMFSKCIDKRLNVSLTHVKFSKASPKSFSFITVSPLKAVQVRVTFKAET